MTSPLVSPADSRPPNRHRSSAFCGSTCRANERGACGPARETAQIGAVLGRDFAYTLLRDVADTNEPGLQVSLDRLAEADLLFVEGAAPQANYRFKHTLVQPA